MRDTFRFVSAGLSLLIVAGCSESSTNPTASPARSVSAQAPSFDFNSNAGRPYGEQQAQFTVGARGGSFSVNGMFTVNFPANSVCDPNVSSYGEDQWNAPCVTLDHDVTVTATARYSADGLAVDFQPHLRFSPDQVVTISTDVFVPVLQANRDYFRQNPAALRSLALYYTPSFTSTPVADYISDRSLITHIDLTTGRVWRRVKHFSGYSQTSGRACDPSPDDPDCIETDM